MPIRYEWTPEQQQMAQGANQWLMDAIAKTMPGSQYMGQETYQPMAQPIANYFVPTSLQDALNSAIMSVGVGPLDIFYHQTTPENQANILQQGFKLMPAQRAYMDEQVPKGIFLKDTPNPLNVGGFKAEWPNIKVDVDTGKFLDIGDRGNITKYLSKESQQKANSFQEVLNVLNKEELAKLQFLDKFLDLPRGQGLNLPLDMINMSTQGTNDFQKLIINQLQELYRHDLMNQGYQGIKFTDYIPNFLGNDSGKRMKTTVVLDPNIIKVQQ